MRQWFRVRSTSAFGQALADIRKDLSLSQDEAAALIGSSRPTISRMELGATVSSELAVRAASEYGYDVILVPRGSRITVEQ